MIDEPSLPPYLDLGQHITRIPYGNVVSLSIDRICYPNLPNPNEVNGNQSRTPWYDNDHSTWIYVARRMNVTRMLGKRAVMEVLIANGVEYIFGNPGTSESPIMDTLEEYPDIKYMLVLQEGVAMGMADAYARATGRPSFVNLHIETGLANGLSLLHNANAGGTPVVLTAGNKDVRELAHGRTELHEMARILTKWSVEITHPEQIPSVFGRAFKEASTPPTGPVFVSFAANALDGETLEKVSPSNPGYHRIAPDLVAIGDATDLLAASENPVMLVGDLVGESQATNEAVQVADMLGARVYASMYSTMNFPTNHPNFRGVLRVDFPEGPRALADADVVLAIGDMATGYYMFSNPQMTYLRPKTKLIHIDSNPSKVGRTQKTDVGIIADPKVALGTLLEVLDSVMSYSEKDAAKERTAALEREHIAIRETRRRRVKARWNSFPMSAERMMAEVAAALPPDVLVADDAVTTQAALHGAMDFTQAGSVLGSRGGAIGWGVGGTMGLKLANPNKPVVGIVGDGSAMMTAQGFWTAAVHKIPVVYIICNNQSYRVLKVNMNTYKSHVLAEVHPESQYIGMDFPLPLNLASMAESMGVHGTKISDPTAIAHAVKNALDLGNPSVLDISIDGTI